MEKVWDANFFLVPFDEKRLLSFPFLCTGWFITLYHPLGLSEFSPVSFGLVLCSVTTVWLGLLGCGWRTLYPQCLLLPLRSVLAEGPQLPPSPPSLALTPLLECNGKCSPVVTQEQHRWKFTNLKVILKKNSHFNAWASMCACVLSHFSHVWLFGTLGTVARQAPLSMEFSRQEHWSRLPFPSPGDLPNPGIKPASLMSPALVDGFFTTSATWKTHEHRLFYAWA